MSKRANDQTGSSLDPNKSNSHKYSPEKMTKACKRGLLARLNRAWTLTPWQPVDIETLDERAWMITYRHRETGEEERSGLLKEELRRAEANNRVGGEA